MTAIILISVFCIAMALGIPIAISMGVSAIGYLYFFMDVNMTIVAQQMFSGIDKFTLLAIPFFMLAGSLMEHGGISQRIIEFAKSLFGSLPGGLALVVVFASMIFAAMTGAGAATTAAIGGMMIPSMKREGYDLDFACALQATAGIFGPLIPPSILMVLFSVSTDTSVSDMLLAGLVPGILMGILVAVTSTIICFKHNYRGEGSFELKEVGKRFSRAILALLTPIIILGGIYSGAFTPTEAAAVGALYALLVGVFIYRELTVKKLGKIFCDTMRTTGGLMLIVSATQAFGWVMTREQVPQTIAQFFIHMTNSPMLFLAAVAVLVMICGCFLDPVPAVMILAPILTPAAVSYGLSPIHFGCVLVVGLVVGLITPPVGINLFVVAAIAERPMHRFLPRLIPFIVTVLVGFVLVIMVPGLSTFLPEMSH